VRPTATDKRSFRSRLRAERGSMLIEVMVGAVILAIATTAVLDGLDGAQSTGGRNKARSVAAALAEQDQERMRSMKVTDLPGYSKTRTVTVRGIDYTVKSSVTWAIDSGGVVSCTNNATTSASLRIVSEVTSRATRGVVDEASLVTPPPGTYGPGQGTIAVQIIDRDQAATQGVTVSIDGPTSNTATTNEFGCAAFPFIPVGTYDIDVAALGLVGWGGAGSPVTKTVTVTEGKTTMWKVELDAPTEFAVRFDTKVGNHTAVAAQSQWATVSNAKLPAPTKKTFQATPPGSPNLSVIAGGLFPFLDGYGVYAGQGPDRGVNNYCPTNDPTASPNTGALAPITVIPGGTQSIPPPGQSVTVRVPAINVRVVTSNSLTNSTAAGINGATVVIKSADPGCGNVFPNQTTANMPYTAPSATYAGALPQPGFPYGNYLLCAQRTVSGTTTHGHADVQPYVTSPTSAHPNEVVANTKPSGNTTAWNQSGGIIRIRMNQSGGCH
jgi:type II secretory pathway pseudopilin PulG